VWAGVGVDRAGGERGGLGHAHVAALGGPLAGGAEVLELGLEPLEVCGPRAERGLIEVLGPELREVLAVAHLGRRADRGRELLQGVLAHRVAHREPAVLPAVVQERGVEQGRHDVERPRRLRPLVELDHRLGGLEREPAREHGQLAHRAQLPRAQQRERGAERGGERRAGARRVHQQLEPVAEPLEDLGDPQRPGARGRELDRQRQPVEPLDQRGQRGPVGLAQREAGPVLEQRRAVRRRQRPERHHLLDRGAQGDARGRQHAEVGRAGQQRVHELGGGALPGLEAVEHEQQLGAGAHRGDQLIDRIALHEVHVERARDRPGEADHPVGGRAGLHEHGPQVGPRGHLAGHPGLAHPRRAP
jgi:hypothetical protein